MGGSMVLLHLLVHETFGKAMGDLHRCLTAIPYLAVEVTRHFTMGFLSFVTTA